jgi:hypothetical protein
MLFHEPLESANCHGTLIVAGGNEAAGQAGSAV